MAIDRLLLKVPEVAEILGLGETTIWRLVATGELPSVRVGGARRITRDDLEAYVQSLRDPEDEPVPA